MLPELKKGDTIFDQALTREYLTSAIEATETIHIPPKEGTEQGKSVRQYIINGERKISVTKTETNDDQYNGNKRKGKHISEEKSVSKIGPNKKIAFGSI